MDRRSHREKGKGDGSERLHGSQQYKLHFGQAVQNELHGRGASADEKSSSDAGV